MWFTCALVYYGFVFISPRFLGKSDDEYADLVVSTIAEFPGLLFPMFFIDRIGRRVTLTILFSFSSFASIVLTFIGHQHMMSLLFLFLGRMCISGAYATLFIYTTEVYPTSLRSTGIGIASSMSRIAGILTSFVSEDAPINAALYTFTIFSIGAAIASRSMPIETAFRTLTEDIEMAEVATSPGGTQLRGLQLEEHHELLPTQNGIKGKRASIATASEFSDEFSDWSADDSHSGGSKAKSDAPHV